jgi:hypothetical protein
MEQDNDEARDRAIRKIKHCLALSSSSNEHDAAAAMRQAKKLMDKYRLTETDLQLSDVGKSDGDVEKSALKRWERELSAIVAEAFNCQSFRVRAWSPQRLCATWKMTFIGVSPAHEIAKYAFDTLHTKATLARREYVAQLKRRALPGKSPETRGDHFALAWVYEVSQKLAAIAPQPDDIDASGERALVTIRQSEDALIESYVKSMTEGRGATQARTPPKAKINPADWVSGAVAGRKTELNHGIGATGADQLQLGVAP